MGRTDPMDPIVLLGKMADHANPSRSVTAERIIEVMEMLLEEEDPLPPGAFCRDSLRFLLGKHSWFPAYADLLRDLRSWWAQHRPPDPTLLAGPRANLSLPDARWHQFYETRRAELLALRADWPDPTLDPPGYAATAMGRLDDLIRQRSPEAWKLLHPEPEITEPVSPIALITSMGARLRLPDTSTVDFHED
jgi:hypothetical protein